MRDSANSLLSDSGGLLSKALQMFNILPHPLNTLNTEARSLLEQATENCYVPVPQVNSVSIYVCLVTFPQTQTVVCDLTKRTPPCFPPDFTSCRFPHKSISVVTSHSARLMSMDFVTTLFPYGLGILGNGLARSYYPDDLFHHMFVS